MCHGLALLNRRREGPALGAQFQMRWRLAPRPLGRPALTQAVSGHAIASAPPARAPGGPRAPRARAPDLRERATARAPGRRVQYCQVQWRATVCPVRERRLTRETKVR